jgi:hypothetical protein
VVNITNIRAMQSYYTMDIEKIPAGTGSGFIWDTKGMTGRHCAMPCQHAARSPDINQSYTCSSEVHRDEVVHGWPQPTLSG